MRGTPEIDGDIPALIGTSAAIALSGMPFSGPIGAARVCYLPVQRGSRFSAKARAPSFMSSLL